MGKPGFREKSLFFFRELRPCTSQARLHGTNLCSPHCPHGGRGRGAHADPEPGGQDKRQEWKHSFSRCWSLRGWTAAVRRTPH